MKGTNLLRFHNKRIIKYASFQKFDKETGEKLQVGLFFQSLLDNYLVQLRLLILTNFNLSLFSK